MPNRSHRRGCYAHGNTRTKRPSPLSTRGQSAQPICIPDARFRFTAYPTSHSLFCCLTCLRSVSSVFAAFHASRSVHQLVGVASSPIGIVAMAARAGCYVNMAIRACLPPRPVVMTASPRSNASTVHEIRQSALLHSSPSVSSLCPLSGSPASPELVCSRSFR